MKKKITVLALCALLFALCYPAEAQQTAKIPRIGFLVAPPFPLSRPGRRISAMACASLGT